MTDLYVHSDYLSDYTCDQAVIIKKRFLKYISRVKYKEDEPYSPAQIPDWYPLTNSFYPYTEDVDAFARVNHLLGSKPSFESLTSLPSCESPFEEDSYSERGAQLQYLSSNPVSFLILGKPGIGEQDLGRLLADHWKCVYIDPETLLREEIESGSHAGQCIEFNLRCGRAVGVDVLVRLVEKRVKSKSAQHRGFVICGFPLIPNDLYTEDPVSSESAIFNVREIFEELYETAVEIGVPPDVPRVSRASQAEEVPGEEENEAESGENRSEKTVILPTQNDVPLDIGSATSKVCVSGELGNNFEDQINLIFSLFKKPFLVIYIMCNNCDVISKHKDYRFDLLSKQMVDLQREYSDKAIYTFFSRTPGANEEVASDFINVVKNNAITLFSPVTRLLVRLQKDFPANVSVMLERYRYMALPTIERHVLVHDSQYFVKVDGRISPIRMFSALKTRLSVLPLQKVIIPEKLFVPSEAGEGGPVEDLNVEELTFEECYQLFRKKQIASPIFKWGWSDWHIKCPVSMKEGEYKDGDPKFAVHFMNKIFFLSSEDAFLKFYRNPRPYLLAPYPKLSCKIFVVGPRCSGRTAVSKCLGYLLKGEVLDYNKLLEDFKKMKNDELKDKIRSGALQEAIAILNQKRREEWEKRELHRQSQVDEWLRRQQLLLEETIKLKEYLIEEDEDVSLVLEMSSFPITLSYNRQRRSLKLTGSTTSILSAEPQVEKIKQTIAELQKLIDISDLPGLDDIALCEELLADTNKLLDYLPPQLLPPQSCDIEPATALDDFVKEYAENVVQNTLIASIELTLEDVVDLLVDKIKEIEERSVEQGNNKGGWIVDGFPPEKDLLEKLENYFPDNVFVLKDTSEHQFLLQRFETRGQNEFRDFRQFFMEMGKIDAAWRSPSLRSTVSYKSQMARDFVTDILNETYFLAEKKESDDQTQEEKDAYFRNHPKRAAVAAYKKDLIKFHEELESLLNFLLDCDITVSEITVTDKPLNILLKEIVKNVDDRYRQLPSVFTDEDRAEELEDFGEPELQGEEMGEGEEKENTEDLFSQNRRFGDTFNYCPVTFHNHWVLWKGKEEFTVKFENKLYLMGTENNMNEFINDPRRYLEIDKPPESFPPPRICIVGLPGSGKTTVMCSLRRNLGLYGADYIHLIKKFLIPKSKFELLEILKMGIAGQQGEIVKNYLESDEPLPEEILNALILPFWFEDPKKTFGFVFDGFPKRPSDVQYMIEHAAVPDIVIELSITEEEIYKRLVENFVENWERNVVNKEFKQREIMHTWEEMRIARYAELMEQRKEERYAIKMQERDERSPESELKFTDYLEENETEEESPTRFKSQISYDSVAEEADVKAVNKILEEELPQPVFEEPEESIEVAIGGFSNDLRESYETEVNFLRITRENCENQLIPWVTVDAGMASEKVFVQVMLVVDKYKFRNDSLFERVYDISVELAEKLLANGYYFLSKFGKTCPVQVYENINPMQMYLPLEQKFLLLPVIHRQYIYFLAGKEYRDKFKQDPLRYVFQSDCSFPLIPLRLAVTGPPKSGKTKLAERFQRDWGMKVISRGRAGRYVLRYLEFSELAQNMESVLRLGWELTNEMVIKCVEAVAFDGRSITQGFVLDGFPNCIEEVRHLAQVGLVPHLVIDLQADHADIYEFLAGDTGKRELPVFSKKFIDHRYEEWSETEADFKYWLDKEYQIVAKVLVKPSKWGVWTATSEQAATTFYEIKHYHKFAARDMALRLGYMQITPLEFIERQGSYKHYCPCCLHYDNTLISGGEPPDRTGLVQFRKYYYYVCSEHIAEFVNDPEQFLSPYNNHMLPSELPRRVFLLEMPDNVYENGFCIVCYLENQPRYVLKKGTLEYSVLFYEKVYLFDSFDCMTKFMRKPHIFFARKISFIDTNYPSLKYNELPVLGMLQQYDVKQVIRAITNTANLRPVIPGLSPEVSASLNMALFLKLHNPRTPQKFMPLYQEARNLYHERRLNLISYLAQMKKMANPYLYYDEPVPKFVDPLAASLAVETKEGEVPPNTAGSTAMLSERSGSANSLSREMLDYILNRIDYSDGSRRVPVPDERFDYLCNYFKPVSKVPAFLKVVDIAGLVKGASEGQGLGNAFLSHISACDAIFHLLRAFEDSDVTHVEGDVDPVRDLEIIGEELRLKDEEQLLANLDKLERTVVRGGDKKQKPEYDTLVKIKSVLVDQKQHIRFADWATNDIEVLNKYLFLTSKPMIYLVNLSDKDYIKKKNKWLLKIKEWVDKNDPGATIIPFSGMFEHKLTEIEDDPILKQKYLEDNNVHSALDKIILQGYKALQLEYFFTAGPDEVKAWTIQKGTKAPQAAGKIHTDFEKGFIMAEVMKFHDFKEEGSESAVKAAGKYRQQGRNYVVEDGDIIYFKFNAGAGLKDAKKK